MELWDLRKGCCVKLLAKDKRVWRLFVQETSVYLVRSSKDILILEGCLND